VIFLISTRENVVEAAGQEAAPTAA
jgi:hypothetical protein